jgi:hypothetical protein
LNLNKYTPGVDRLLSNLRVNRNHQSQIKKRRLDPIFFCKILQESDYKKYTEKTGVMPTHEKLNALRQFADIEQHQKLSLLLASKPSSPSSRASESRVRDPFKVTGSFHVFKTQDGRQENQFGCNSFSSLKSR